MMKIYVQLWWLSALFGIAGCSRDFDLRKSTFFEDIYSSGLPEYSEWGYNTFGAYFDRQPFTSGDWITPLKIISKDSSTSFVFIGMLKSQDYYYQPSEDMTLIIKIPGYLPMKYDDLVLLNDTSFNLASPNFEVFITADTATRKAEILSGQFEFKKAQYLYVDKVPQEVILSGHFEFKALIDEEPVTMADGRFDIGAGNDNFYSY